MPVTHPQLRSKPRMFLHRWDLSAVRLLQAGRSATGAAVPRAALRRALGVAQRLVRRKPCPQARRARVSVVTNSSASWGTASQTPSCALFKRAVNKLSLINHLHA